MCGKASVSYVTLCHLPPVRLTRRALKGGPVRPSNIFYVLMQDHPVTSCQWDQPSPSLSALCDHPRHCSTTPGAVATSRRYWDVRGQDVAATAAVPRTAPVNSTLEPLSHDYAGSNHDARPAAAPSPSLLTPCGRPCHCCTTPRTAATTPTLLSTRGRDVVTPAAIPRTDHCQRPPRARSKPLRSTTTPLPSKPLLFGHRMHRDAATGARFARTAINSTALFIIPQHV
jgi:hypothetical protein